MSGRDVEEMGFVKGTELKFAEYIEEHAVDGDIASVIKAADDFCWNSRWMMNLGDAKGKIVDAAILERKPRSILELGTYCGYSSTRFCGLVDNEARIATIDVSPQVEVTKRVWAKAGVSHMITQLVGRGDEVIPTLKGQAFDLVFIDHEKTCYMSDLVLLEEAGCISSGTWVVADNVLVFNIKDYLDHVRNDSVYETEVFESLLEYTTDEKRIDGIAVSKRK